MLSMKGIMASGWRGGGVGAVGRGSDDLLVVKDDNKTVILLFGGW